jgi:hypothetical protein
MHTKFWLEVLKGKTLGRLDESSNMDFWEVGLKVCIGFICLRIFTGNGHLVPW